MGETENVEEPVFKLPPNGPGIQTLTTAESDRLRGQGGIRGNVHPCLTCNDRGTFKWYDRWGPDPSRILTYECPCNDQWIMHRWFSAHGIGLSYQRIGIADTWGMKDDCSKAISEWMAHREEYIRSGVGLVLHGSGGTGKTLSTTLILKRLLSEGADGFFLTFKTLLDYQSNGFRDKDERDWFNRRIRQAGVLVIDDIGKEFKSSTITDKGRKEGVSTNYALSTLDSVLRSRVADALPTIVTTNIEFNAMGDGYSDSVLDLLVERSVVHRFSGESFRGNSQKRLVTEARSGLSRPIVEG